MNVFRATIVALAVAALGMTTSLITIAQPPSSDAQTHATPSESPDATSPPIQPPPNYSDAELKSFAGAVVEVHRINDEYIPKLQSAATPDEEQQLEAAALHDMVQAVENEGISVEKYEEILANAQHNRSIAERLKKPLKDALSRTRI